VQAQCSVEARVQQRSAGAPRCLQCRLAGVARGGRAVAWQAACKRGGVGKRSVVQQRVAVAFSSGKGGSKCGKVV